MSLFRLSRVTICGFGRDLPVSDSTCRVSTLGIEPEFNSGLIDGDAGHHKPSLSTLFALRALRGEESEMMSLIV